ncbi:hypothetical protein KF728_09775 [Candidatus Obscuribacterales bacterium]|nr:hypothetical protein [Candidatus Obscuribacterales bacterium]
MTRRCIYCLETERKFDGEEHVVSQFLGKFDPDLFLKVVCDTCNSKVISKLESTFKEDAMEGILSAQYRCRKDSSIRFKNDKLTTTFRVNGKPTTMFSNIFPCLDPATGKIELIPHVLVKGPNGRNLVMFWEGLRDAKRFDKRMNWTGKKNLTMYFFGDDDTVGKMKREIRRRGLDFREDEENIEKGESSEEMIFNYEFNATLDRDVERFISKIAFNYFAYCTLQSNLGEYLYDDYFAAIRTFVIYDVGESPVTILKHGYRTAGTENRPHIAAHFLTFYEANGRLLVNVSLFGFLTYRVQISAYPFKSIPPSVFGKGYVFDVAKHKILRPDTGEPVQKNDVSLLRH